MDWTQGDPGAMRAAAAAWRGAARAVSAGAEPLASAGRADGLRGPAAQRYAAATTAAASTAGSVATQLSALAGGLERDAAQVEAAQREEKRRRAEQRAERAL